MGISKVFSDLGKLHFHSLKTVNDHKDQTRAAGTPPQSRSMGALEKLITAKLTRKDLKAGSAAPRGAALKQRGPIQGAGFLGPVLPAAAVDPPAASGLASSSMGQDMLPGGYIKLPCEKRNVYQTSTGKMVEGHDVGTRPGGRLELSAYNSPNEDPLRYHEAQTPGKGMCYVHVGNMLNRMFPGTFLASTADIERVAKVCGIQLEGLSFDDLAVIQEARRQAGETKLPIYTTGTGLWNGKKFEAFAGGDTFKDAKAFGVTYVFDDFGRSHHVLLRKVGDGQFEASDPRTKGPIELHADTAPEALDKFLAQVKAKHITVDLLFAEAPKE